MTAAEPAACVVTVTTTERGTFRAPDPVWRVVERDSVEIGDDGACRRQDEVSWRREADRFMGEGSGRSVIVPVDGAGRALGSLEGYGSGGFVHRWRVQRNAEGRVTRMEESGHVVESADCPIWEDDAARYQWLGDHFVRIVEPDREVDITLDELEGLVESVVVLQRDLDAFALLACGPSDPEFGECMQRAVEQAVEDVPLRAAPLDVAVARVVGWTQGGLPARMLWMPGGMGGDAVLDASWFFGEERRAYDRLDRLIRHEWIGERAARRTTYRYSAGCVNQRDWRTLPAACPVATEPALWMGWPTL